MAVKHVGIDTKLDFDDVLVSPCVTEVESRSQVKLEVQHGEELNHMVNIPVMASNMTATGTQEMALALAEQNAITCLHKHHSMQELREVYKELTPEQVTNNVFVSIGMGDDDFLFYQKLSEDLGFAPNVCIDVANGYMVKFHQFCERVAREAKEAVVMAGNVCTPEGVRRLSDHGVDIVKLGIGPGSACTTRIKTGIGHSQFSAILECVQKNNNENLKFCSDGGCRTPADLVKAFAAGANFVMLGGMLAGTDESDVERNEGGVVYHGMASRKAQEIHGGGLKEYRASEGAEIKTSEKGQVSEVIKDIYGGLRSACTYTGFPALEELIKGNVQFTRVNKVHR